MKVFYEIKKRNKLFVVIGVIKNSDSDPVRIQKREWLKDAVSIDLAEKWIKNLLTDFKNEEQVYKYWNTLKTVYVIGA